MYISKQFINEKCSSTIMFLSEQYLTEKLEDIRVDKKWYDLFNTKLKKALLKETEMVFLKHFRLSHPIIDSRKTSMIFDHQILGVSISVTIVLYDKFGNRIMYESEDFPGQDQFAVYLKRNKKSGRWSIEYYNLNVKEEYRNKGIERQLMQSVNKCVKILQNERTVTLETMDDERYFISRMPGVRFADGDPYGIIGVQKAYKYWCRRNKIPYEILTLPSEYPRDFLTSKHAPPFIEYVINI